MRPGMGAVGGVLRSVGGDAGGTYPAETNTRDGVEYGPTGVEYTGTGLTSTTVIGTVSAPTISGEID